MVCAKPALAGQLRLASAATVNFTASFISSIAKTLPSTLFSTGGDEVNEDCYNKDTQMQADLTKSKKTLFQALDVFTQTSHNALRKIGKTPVVWEGKFRFFNINTFTLYTKDTMQKWRWTTN